MASYTLALSFTSFSPIGLELISPTARVFLSCIWTSTMPRSLTGLYLSICEHFSHHRCTSVHRFGVGLWMVRVPRGTKRMKRPLLEQHAAGFCMRVTFCSGLCKSSIW